jgi:hypothetical protein
VLDRPGPDGVVAGRQVVARVDVETLDVLRHATRPRIARQGISELIPEGDISVVSRGVIGRDVGFVVEALVESDHVVIRFERPDA